MSINANVDRAKTDYDRAYEAGKKSEYDAFWDAFQQNGWREDYERAFGGQGWTDKTFTPKYDIVPIGYSAQTFHGSRVVDLAACLEKSGVTLDTSKSHYLGQFAQESWIQRMPVIDMSYSNQSSVIDTQYAFGYSAVVSFEKIIFSEWTIFANTFIGCTSLVDLPVEGTIGQNGFSVQWSTKLTHESLMSIINALADKSADTSGTVWTVTLGSDNIAKLSEEEQRIAKQKGWTLA